jgi:hypothetical protein
MIISKNKDLLQITNTNTHRTLEMISINRSLRLEGPISLRPYFRKGKDSNHFEYYAGGIFSEMTDDDIEKCYILSLGYNEDLIFRTKETAFAALEAIDECLN